MEEDRIQRSPGSIYSQRRKNDKCHRISDWKL